MKPKSDKIPQGLDAWVNGVAGRLSRLKPRQSLYLRRAEVVLSLQPRFEDMSDSKLNQRLKQISLVFRRGRAKRKHTIYTAALMREAVFRATGLRLFREQVAAGLALYDGCFVEMATGEGKSLTATLPAAMHAWRGRGCHVVTVNDYLAQRDADGFRDFYTRCGLTVSHVTQDSDPGARQRAYQADITYLTNKEVCADYLRDRLAEKQSRKTPRSGSATARLRDAILTQRPLYCALVDEADSVLIDEAVTPLLISGESAGDEQREALEQAEKVAEALRPEQHFKLDARRRTAELTDRGFNELAARVGGLGGIWRSQRRSDELVCNALAARHFYTRDKQYVVHEDKVVIVDEFTGRLMPDRQWQHGLHQAVEVRESLPARPILETHAQISFQRFFRLYPRLSGMSGTLAEVRGELWNNYGRPLVRIPTHQKCIRKALGVELCPSQEAKLSHVVELAEQAHQSGRPVLIGTRSVSVSEQISRMLQQRNRDHQVLNAVRNELEAQVVAAAGQSGHITVATNMAGRGTDIKLDDQARVAGGLLVIATECHESGRIDRQLAGRAGRQGDPGNSITVICLEDFLFATHGGWMHQVLSSAMRARLVPSALAVKVLIRWAQGNAEHWDRMRRSLAALTDQQTGESLIFSGN